VETYRPASGLIRVYRIREAKVCLIAKGAEPREIDSYLVISEYADEMLINDQMISSFGIIIEDPAKELWRLRGRRRLGGVSLDEF